MNCPTCGAAFEEENYEGVTIDVCSGCKGVWLDRDEMDQIVKQRQKAFKPNEVDAVNRLCGATGVGKEQQSRDINCPKCNDAMKTYEYNYSSGIIVDRCAKNCGVWLDADELEKVQIHAELWQDKLEAHRERFANLATQVEQDARAMVEKIEQAAGPSRFRFVNAVVRGLVRLSG